MEKESMLDVLIYLFEHLLEEGMFLVDDRESVRSKLVFEGFQETMIDKALIWLDGMSLPELEHSSLASVGPSFRIFSDEEQERLSAECRGFLLELEQGGLIDSANREMIIERALALDVEELDIEQFRWVIQLFLSNVPDENPLWMEEHMLYMMSDMLH